MMTPAQPARTGLRLGFVPGVTLAKWRRIWAERFPRVPLDVAQITEADQRRLLVSGELDMCFARLPLETDGLHAIPLYEEQPVVWMHKDFLLSALDEVTTADLADFRIVTDYSDDSIDLAVYNAAALRVPLSVARTQSRKDMVHRPVLDAAPTTIVLSWRVDNDNPWIEEFIGVVRGRTTNSSRTAQQRTGQRDPGGKSSDSGQQRTGDGQRGTRARDGATGQRPAARRSGGKPPRGRGRRPRR